MSGKKRGGGGGKKSKNFGGKGNGGGGKDKGKQEEHQPVEHLVLTKGEWQLVDGSLLEGGGQILRNTFAICALLNKPLRIEKIRAGRDNPGLRHQHLKGIELVNELFRGRLTGGSVGSSIVSFIPKAWNPKSSYLVNVGTAGSLPMLVQATLPCLTLGAPGPLEIKFIGGTNVAHSPPFDFLVTALRPTLQLFGVDFNVTLERRGFYPRGGGEMTFHTKPSATIKPIELVNPGTVTSIHVLAYVSGRLVSSEVADRISKAAQVALKEHFPAEVTYEIETLRDHHGTDGCGIQLTAKTSTGCLISGSCLGEKGTTSETVGQNAAKKLIHDVEEGGCMDEYLQDQLMIFMALAKGRSRIRTGSISLHSKTSIHFLQQLTDARFTITPTGEFKTHLEDSYFVECEGIGYTNPFFTGSVSSPSTSSSSSSSTSSSSSS